MPTYTVAPLAPEDREELLAVEMESFGFSREVIEFLAAAYGEERVRTVKAGDTVAGGLITFDARQFFGGNPVPTSCVAAVCTRPEHRGMGAATALLASHLEEQRRAGIPLATLYPSNLPTYRKSGYEVAGERTHLAMGLDKVNRVPSDLEASRVPDGAIIETLAPLQGRMAGERDGFLERPACLWGRLRDNLGEKRYAYAFRPAGGEVEGYAILRHAGGGVLEVVDRALSTPDAARAYWNLLAAHRSMFNEVRWTGRLNDWELGVLPNALPQVRGLQPWMLRILDAAAALEARGYPAACSGVLVLQVDDPVLGMNSGTFVLTVSNGRGLVKRAAEGLYAPVLEVDARGLAALYSGFQTAGEVVRSGRAAGPDSAVDLADMLFAGSRPCMAEDF